MRGKKTSPEQIEEIKALSLVHSPAVIAEKTRVSLRTVYEVLKRKDNPVIEAKREEKRLQIIDKVWANKEGEILKLKEKSDLLLDSINPKKAEDASLSQLAVGYGVLFDKRRLLNDESTTNNSVFIVEQIYDRRFHQRVIETEEKKSTVEAEK